MTPEHKALVAALTRKAETDGLLSVEDIHAVAESLSAQGEAEAVAWPDPKVTNPDIAAPTGVPYLDSLIHQLLDVQQDINLAANETMIQSLADASSFLDEVERCIRRFAHSRPAPAPVPDAVTKALLIGRSYVLDAMRNDGGIENCEIGYRADYDVISAAIASNKPVGDGDYFGTLVDRARAAASKASTKFPQPNYVTLKIAEEAGEVVRGAVHYAENRMEWSEVEGEIVQLLAMLIRFVTEGDQINGVIPPRAASSGEEGR